MHTTKPPLPLALLILASLAYFASFALDINAQQNDGRYMLHMDERISYDQINAITSSHDAPSLIVNLVGSDFRYGRLIYVLPSPFSAVARHFWGEKGFITATRLVFSLGLILCAWVVFLLGKQTWLALICALSVFILPFSAYFSMIAKPEVFQILTLIGGIWFLTRGQMLYAGLLLGLSLGFKLSSLFAAPVLLLWLAQAIWLGFRRDGLKARQTTENTVMVSLGFTAGMLANVPILAVIPIGWRYYLYSTVSNASHGSDILGANFFLWIDNLTLVFGGPASSLAFLILLGAAGCFSLASLFGGQADNTPATMRQALKQKIIGALNTDMSFGVVLSLIALAWTAAIVLTVPRLWGHYLFPPIVLSLAALAWFSASSQRPPKRPTLLYLVLLSTMGLFIFDYQSNYAKGATFSRFDGQQMETKAKQYEIVKAYLAQQTRQPKAALIHLDPRLFQPDSSENYEIVNYWGAYFHWGENPSAIIAQADIFQKIAEPKSVHHLLLNRAFVISKSYLQAPDGNCEGDGCYQVVAKTEDLIIIGKTPSSGR